MQYERYDIEFARGTFRVRGDVVEVYPSYQDQAYRIEFWGDEIDAISTIDPLLGEVLQKHTTRVPIYPKTHYVMSQATIKRAIKTIKEELDWWEPKLIEEGKAGRGATPSSAHDVRPGDDEGDGFLSRHRKLFAASDGQKRRASRRRLCSIICRATR